MKHKVRHIRYPLSIGIFVLIGFLSCNKDATTTNDNNGTKVVVITTTSTSGDTTTYTIGSLVVTATKTSPCYPSTEIFTFKAAISGITDSTTISWYFGDGHIATGISVQHGYDNAAPFVVQIDVKNSKGVIVNSATFPLKASGQQLKPVAIFSAKNDFPNNLNYVTFNSASSVNHGSIVKFHWDWGDGTTNDIADALTRHGFPLSINDVTYTVKLTITTDAGCTADTSLAVWVPGAYPITGNFSVNQLNACTNESFNFTAQATSVPGGSVYYWHWSDGTHDDSGYTAQHIFAYMNDYDVIMYIKLNGHIIYTVHKDINAKGQSKSPKPIASFQYTSVSTYPTNELASFNCQSVQPAGGGAIDGYYWDFGNGITDNNFNSFTEIRYTRGNPGTGSTDYKVRLIVTGNGCADTAYQTVTIPSQ